MAEEKKLPKKRNTKKAEEVISQRPTVSLAERLKGFEFREQILLAENATLKFEL